MEILELGCGAGRITHALLDLGYRVTAVDESAEMLAQVRGATTVRARIEDLELGRLFPVVLLMSNLVNQPDEALRSALLASCRRHVASEGLVLIERLDPQFGRGSDTETTSRFGGLVITLRDVRREGADVFGVVRYDAGEGGVWEHAFGPARLLDDTDLEKALAKVRLRMDRIVDERRRWVVAAPIA